MFKAAFPWASQAEEEMERKYQKTFPSAGAEEMAGSVWIAPEEGKLDLLQYYINVRNMSESNSLQLWHCLTSTRCDTG